MPPTGKGTKKILFIAEVPGKKEDERSIQLIGKTGQKLRRILKSLKPSIDLDTHCRKINAVNCRTIEKDGNNRTPTDDEINYCRPNVIKEINSHVYNEKNIDEQFIKGILNKNGLYFVLEEGLTTSGIRGAFKVYKGKPAIYISTYKKRVDAKIINALASQSYEAFFKFSIDAKSINEELETGEKS